MLNIVERACAGIATETAATEFVANNTAAKRSKIRLDNGTGRDFETHGGVLVEALEAKQTSCWIADVIGAAKAVDKSDDNATGVIKAIMATAGTVKTSCWIADVTGAAKAVDKSDVTTAEPIGVNKYVHRYVYVYDMYRYVYDRHRYV
jgi:hypothetical protein